MQQVIMYRLVGQEPQVFDTAHNNAEARRRCVACFERYPDAELVWSAPGENVPYPAVVRWPRA